MSETGEQRMWVDEGLLTWDGRILELFRADGKSGSWRVHAATIRRWELEPRRGVALLKVHITDRFYESVLVPDADVPAIEALMAEVDAVS